MTQYRSFDPNAEINGNSVLAFTTNMLHDEIADILKKHGLDQVDPQAWYPIQSILDVMSDISEGEDVSSHFVSIGMAAGNLGIQNLPEAMKNITMEQFILGYGQVYKTRVRGGDAGEVNAQKLNDQHYRVEIRLPFPDDVFYGVFYAYARHFCPPNRTFSLSYDPDIPRRDEGGEVTVVHITYK